MYSCNILADSITSHGAARLTTMEVTFPRFLLAEVNTHRMLSRNSASSRAIPPERIIERVVNDPFVPAFNHRVKGMGVGDELSGTAQAIAQVQWLKARDAAVDVARQLMLLDVDKSRVNRLLEPFMWHTAIISGTDWDNFFALRIAGSDPRANPQPEFDIIARMMLDVMKASTPEILEPNQWHLPMLTPSEKALARGNPTHYWPLVSAGRVARVSFDTHWRDEDPDASHERAERLTSSGHWSPLEHPAMAWWSDVRMGNFLGFRQLRKFFKNEDNFARLKHEQEALV